MAGRRLHVILDRSSAVSRRAVRGTRPPGPGADVGQPAFAARIATTEPEAAGALAAFLCIPVASAALNYRRNPGGPGTPGADDALYADDPVSGYPPDMLRRFDMIGFDPRGIGRSRSAVCDETITESIPARPRDAAVSWTAAGPRQARDSLERGGQERDDKPSGQLSGG
ncbi:hypothetical protein AB0E67_10765 [Streptomyces sp. NPDC032161]|uniref:hypothetical protein n=1 Tax=unclassified Streptomyces TaxID=2593676 RepID=UPI0033ECB1AB